MYRLQVGIHKFKNCIAGFIYSIWHIATDIHYLLACFGLKSSTHKCSHSVFGIGKCSLLLTVTVYDWRFVLHYSVYPYPYNIPIWICYVLLFTIYIIWS